MPSAKEAYEFLSWEQSTKDIEYFLKTHYKIAIIGKGAGLFDLWPFQYDALKKFGENDLLVGLKARQIGMTTLAMGYAFHDAYFNESHPWTIVSRNEKQAAKALSRIAYGYDRMPQWLKNRGPKLTARTQTILEFDNGSYVEAIPSTPGAGRGDSVYGVILDEYAHMEYAAEVFGSMEPLAYGKLFVFSTANGMGNSFHEKWLGAMESDSLWGSMFYPWMARPGRDAEWYAKQQAKFRGQEWLLFQEYPETAEEAFAKSGRTVYGMDVLSYLNFQAFDPFVWQPDSDGVKFNPSDGDYSFHAMRVWEEPVVEVDPDNEHVTVRQPNYVIGCDVAEGLEHGDRTAITVWDANTNTMVASYCGQFPVEELDSFLYDLGEWYFWALIVVERNNHGMVPLVGLNRLRYPRLYRPRPLASRNKERSFNFGWITTSQSKPKMVADFLSALRNFSVQLFDSEFASEAMTFIMDGKGGYSAVEGRHDDFIMATLIGYQGVMDVMKYPIVWRDDRPKPATFDDFFSLKRRNTQLLRTLDIPIGGSVPRKQKYSIFLHPENVKHRTN